MSDPQQKTISLQSPVTASSLASLSIGDIVYINGVIYTGREGVYQRILDEGQIPPLDLAAVSNINFHCSPAASVEADGTYNVGAVTATASFRFSKWMEKWFELSDCKVVIGKGGMPQADYQQYFVPRGAVYLTTVGYGTGALLGRGVKRVIDAHWIEDLGIAQAIWVLEVCEFGPFLVESDIRGNSLFEKSKVEIDKNIDSLYEGLKNPALRRYGETTERTDEVI